MPQVPPMRFRLSGFGAVLRSCTRERREIRRILAFGLAFLDRLDQKMSELVHLVLLIDFIHFNEQSEEGPKN
jgi:hypothetical protein